ncbi:MAG: hypothetical protein LBH93_02615 [Chitinispirillales bacterium]|jgi:hypothetical protein|nr:hypothetical protein [Chitinispirillales bacterium]
MMNRTFLAALICASALAACQSNVKEPLVKVGKSTIGGESMEAFKKLAGIYPEPMPFYFPSQRQPITFITECEAIYQYAKGKPAISQKVTGSLDWAWKKKYYAASLFFDLFPENLGFTNKQLEDYYKKLGAEAFRVTGKAADGQDSSYLPPFDAVKRQVADRYFCTVHKPDSAFLARLTERDQELDSAAVINYWLYSVRSNPGDFYMRLFFKEQTGEEYADSVEQLFDGESKPIKPADIDVIRSWLPDSRKNMRTKDLAEWLYKWQSFSQQAEKLKLTSEPQFKNLLHWAQRIEFAREYLKSKVVPEEEAEAKFSAQDSAIALLTMYDNAGTVIAGFSDGSGLGYELGNIAKTKTGAMVDLAIYAIRKSVKVKFLQNDWRDERDSDPAALIAKADSLREDASDPDMDSDEAELAMAEAESLYRTLAAEFAFAEEGRRAMGELAKALVDKHGANAEREGYQLRAAISSYRKAQILDQGSENLCNSSFMIGFTYDEYLKNLSLAEANYKWILGNAPECALASDAEFMLLHLGEPMASIGIEEIQGQSMRQGRAVDFDEDAEEGGAGAAGAASDGEPSDIEELLNAAL